MADREITQSPTFPSQAITDHTANHAGCPACEFFGAMRLLDPSLPFTLASEIWLTNHNSYIKPGSRRIYKNHRNRLSEFFQNLPLEEIRIGNIRGYQQWRLQKAGAALINAEIRNVLAPILAEIDRWQFFIKVYKPLPEPRRRVRQSLTDEEMRRLMAVALDNSYPRRLLAGHCLLVMANTGMGFGELRYLKRADVILNENEPRVTVNEGTKNDYRIRAISLNWIAMRSLKWILRRWESLGGTSADEYILPHSARHTSGERRPSSHKRSHPPIFTEPMKSIYQACRKILDEAGLTELDPYDMRSHFATKIMEDPDVSEAEAGRWIGHSFVAREMNRRYFAPKMVKMTKAVEKIAVDPEPEVRLIAFPGGKK